MKNRDNIYYWKCDRPYAFHSLHDGSNSDDLGKDPVAPVLKRLLSEKYKSEVFLTPGKGQGNHLTYLARHNGNTFFIRIENGPEKDNYMMVEGRVIEEVKRLGIPTPTILESDTSRTAVDFAYQIMEYLEYPDLNTVHKAKELDIVAVAYDIGINIAKWQSICPPGFGPFNVEMLRKTGDLIGLHRTYPEYYFLNLEKHLEFLERKKFLSGDERNDILEVIFRNAHHLDIRKGCLVHKDLALWNILGYHDIIKAVIDWDDTIVGDPTDDLSLLACFYDDAVVQSAIQGYQSKKKLPDNFEARLYLHLLRNMIVKAVIRVGANYFDRSDDFFLIEYGEEGSSLEQATRQKIFLAYEFLKNELTNKIL